MIEALLPHLPQLLLAWSIQLTGVISPGPSVALILGVAAGQGRGPALITALGIGCASIVLSLATVLGLAALFAQAADLMTLVRFIGAGYLAWLAYGAFRKAMAPPALSAARVAPRSAARLALAGFALQVSNPKAIFFWLAVASVGGVGAAPIPVIALFLLGAFINSTVGHGAWALVLSAGPMRRAYARGRAWIEGSLGVFFAVAALRLATSRG
ncbi:MAG: LysE family translocator [Pseudomonadota bacterium]